MSAPGGSGRQSLGIVLWLLAGAVVVHAAVEWLGRDDGPDGSFPWQGVVLLVLTFVAVATGGTAGRLRTLIGVEWLKLCRGRLLRVGLLVAGAATLLAAFGHSPVKDESGWTLAAHTLGVGFWTAEILVLVIGATSVAGEISQGTMKMILPHAYRRAEWIGAKATVILIAAVLFAVVVCTLGIGCTIVEAGLGDVTREAPTGFGQEDKITVFQTADVMRGRLIQLSISSLVSLVASGLVGLMLSCVFYSLIPALSASFLIFAALKTGDVFLGFSPAVQESVYAHYPDEIRRLVENFGRALNESWSDALLSDGIHVALLTSAICVVAALRLFGRRDLHG